MLNFSYLAVSNLIKKTVFLITALFIGVFVLGLLIGVLKTTNPLLYQIITGNNSKLFGGKSTYISGITKKNVKYVFTASNLSNTLVSFIGSKQTTFVKPKLNIELVSGKTIDVTAGEALLNIYKDEANLFKNVVIQSPNQYKATLQDLLFNFNTGYMVSKNPFVAEVNSYIAKGDSVEIKNNAIFNFTFLNITNPTTGFSASFDNALINDNAKTINLQGNAQIFSANYQVVANFINATYKPSVVNFNFKSEQDFKRISANDNVIITLHSSNGHTSMYADEYIYDVAKEIMVLNAKTNPQVKVQAQNYTATATNRIEYQPVKQLIVLRGNPNILYGDYNIKASTISLQLNNNRKLKYSELFNNVIITNKDNKITADYGIYNATNNIINLQDNVTITNNSGFSKGCSLTINLNNGNINLTACNAQSTNIKINNK